MTTSFAKTIDQTEGPVSNGNVVSMQVGAGGVTAGQSLKLSGGKVVVCTAKTDVFYGVALETADENYYIKIGRSGCRVKTSATLTADGYVQPKDAGSGEWEDYTNGTKVAIVEVAAASASVIRLL